MKNNEGVCAGQNICQKTENVKPEIKSQKNMQLEKISNYHEIYIFVYQLI